MIKTGITNSLFKRIKLFGCVLLLTAIPLMPALKANASMSDEASQSGEPGESGFYRTSFLSCERLTPLQYVERTTGAKVGEAKLVYHKATHGGFHGDGDTLIIIACSELGADFESTLSAWRALPMSDKLHEQIFGSRDAEVNFNDVSLIFDMDEDLELPSVKNGLYFLNNRHDNAAGRDDENLNYYSWNFSFAVYDLNAKMLYYIEVDT